MVIIRKYIYFVFFCLITSKNFSQKFFDRISFKTGYSLSVTQLGLSPFADTRRLTDRSIQSIFFNIQYIQPINPFSAIAIGIQNVEKGFKSDWNYPYGNLQYFQNYEYYFSYIEVPINYTIQKGKYSLIGGVIVSYLYEDTYRYQEDQVLYSVQGPVYYELIESNPFSIPSRFNKWDFGANLGVSRKLNKHFSIELTAQKHFINVDNWNTQDVKYNLCFLLGIRYYFLSSK